jgi:hypothetical protein
MNYFAHGCRFFHDPLFLAGTALPDWLNVIDRRTKARSKRAAELLHDDDPVVASMAAGVIQHHADDYWFHGQLPFIDGCVRLSAALRQSLGGDDSPRPSFVAHVAIELLLDSSLMAQQEGGLEGYYRMLGQLHQTDVQRGAERLTGRSIPDIPRLLEGFLRVRFLSDYRDDAKLLYRLNQVLQRVGLPPLPELALSWLASARREVNAIAPDLFPPPFPVTPVVAP